MIRKLIISILSALVFTGAFASDLPNNIYVGDRKEGHVQGIALDREKGFLYLSFTTQFLKTDLDGNVIGSIDRIQGHLGAMTLGPDGRVYASLECKDDAIGSSIARNLGIDNLEHAECTFYVAIIDVDRITRTGMDPEKDGVMTTVCIKDAVRDYASGAYGCSGIDGITFAPALGHPDSKLYLYVAYGIYEDLGRKDNDHQVLLCYDIARLKKYETPVVFGKVPENGPEKPARKFFVYTGNTNWGIQNMAYDNYTGRIYMAVYRGHKAWFPNYQMFSISVDRMPERKVLKGVGEKGWLVPLSEAGLYDEASGIYGWNFKWGSTGLCPIGDGLWYISENGKDRETGLQYCNARLYKWTGNDDRPFEAAAD